MKLLGEMEQFKADSAHEMSAQVKLLIDSTPSCLSTGTEFPVWLLVEKVELFIKSDILRNGVVLVDLPGLGDAVESRALVAERAFD